MWLPSLAFGIPITGTAAGYEGNSRFGGGLRHFFGKQEAKRDTRSETGTGMEPPSDSLARLRATQPVRDRCITNSEPRADLSWRLGPFRAALARGARRGGAAPWLSVVMRLKLCPPGHEPHGCAAAAS